MGVKASSINEGKELLLRISGRFDHTTMAEFRAAYENPQRRPDTYIVDFQDITYLDSSGLSMLLLLHVHAGQRKYRVQVVNARPDVLRSLEIAKFGELFDIR
jgi:anti-anti-sigma factor